VLPYLFRCCLIFLSVALFIWVKSWKWDRCCHICLLCGSHFYSLNLCLCYLSNLLLLQWSSTFPEQIVTELESVRFVKKLLAVAVSNISYLRSMFPERAFGDRRIEGIRRIFHRIICCFYITWNFLNASRYYWLHVNFLYSPSFHSYLVFLAFKQFHHIEEINYNLFL